MAPALDGTQINGVPTGHCERLLKRTEVVVEEEPRKAVPYTIGGAWDVQHSIAFV
jgi:hypothetical protein